MTFMFDYLQRMKAYAQPIMVLMFVLSPDGSKGPIPLFLACLADPPADQSQACFLSYENSRM
jgi:hypothetical protein